MITFITQCSLKGVLTFSTLYKFPFKYKQWEWLNRFCVRAKSPTFVWNVNTLSDSQKR